MRLVLVHARAATLELLRYPAFSVPTLAFPGALLPALRRPALGLPIRPPARIVRRLRRAGRRVLPVRRRHRGRARVAVGARTSARCRSAPATRFARPRALGVPLRRSPRPASSSPPRSRRPTPASPRAAGSPWRPRSCSAVSRSRCSGSRSATGPRRAARCPSRTSSTSCSRLPAACGRRRRTSRTRSQPLSPLVRPARSATCSGAPPRAHLWQPRDWLLLAGWAVVLGLVAAWGYHRDEGRRYG